MTETEWEQDYKGEEIYKGYYILPYDGYWDVHYASRNKADVDYMLQIGQWYVSSVEAHTLFATKAEAKAWITDAAKLDRLTSSLERAFG
jgi:hypothetical protein